MNYDSPPKRMVVESNRRVPMVIVPVLFDIYIHTDQDHIRF